ncbi:uncharacterized protein LOC133916147 isoform X2 [Phragmites australis]|uniref:uncharacterized protein LOC133916147 isoform X2 n=1 Tax=Phragmites australis TaxID=29695 RepID=UPI002D768C6F|nr:uncharacterized protein LOC133916147 isoform X2 [Phragmites australis]
MAAGGGGGGGAGAGGRSTLAAAREAPGPAAIPAGAVAAAEKAAAEVVRRVQPTEASERRRAEVVDYARRLVGAALGCEVFAFGSVPLKTYLPDGDVDLTVLGNTSYNSSLINDVYGVLESEERNSDAEFEVKNLDLINAEVRLIKCTIENIIVDISFNQTGGICALCFLELVDREVGKNHLFKRSIVLIKAWFYYESRLLGAYHGLISTYALEILILYILNRFHKNVHGPLEVLYRFLEYFSKFDWDNYCISLNGPVALSSLPNLIVEATGTHADDLLFDKEFLKCSVDKAFVPQRDSDACYTRFCPKHLNIIDPLKEYNNLGRSVNKASFHRIRTAFSYGARKLGQILTLPSQLVPDEIYSFFKNTLGRNGRGVRPDIRSDGVFHPSLDTDKSLLEDIASMKISYKKEDENRTPRHLSKSLDNNNSYDRIDIPTYLGSCFPGGHIVASNTYLSTGSPRFVHHAPEQYSSLYLENGNSGSEKCYMDHEMEQVSHCSAKALHVDVRSSIQSEVHLNNPSHAWNSSAGGNTLELTNNKKNWSAHVEKQHLTPSSLSLPDLSGDLDSQFRCLRQVQYHLEYLFDGFLQSVQESSSDDKVHKDSFHVASLSSLLNSDTALPGLLFPSSTKNNGRKSSPVSCTHSHYAEDVSQYLQDEEPWDVACQQNISLHSGTDVPSNGLSPSSHSNSEISSVSWCYSFEDIPKKNGTASFTKKRYDTYKEHLTSRENVTILTNQPVKIKSNQTSAPGGSFVSYTEQVALNSRTKGKIIGQPLKVWDSPHGYIHSDRKTVEKQSCDTENEFIRGDNEPREIPKYRQDVCSNKNMLQRRCYDTGMEFARPPSALKQKAKYQAFNSQNTPKDCTRASRSNNLSRVSREQSYGTRKEHQILDWTTKQIPLKLQNKRRGQVCSKKNSAERQNFDNHKEHLSFVRGADHIPCSRAVSTINGLETEVCSDKHVDNGGQVRPLLPEVPLSCHNINSQEKPPVSEVYSDKHIGNGGQVRPLVPEVPLSRLNSQEKPPVSNVYSDKHVDNGGQVRPLLPEVPLSPRNINSQEKPPVSDTSQPSFPFANGPPVENIEFGSLGPFALTFFSSKSNEATNTHSASHQDFAKWEMKMDSHLLMLGPGET